MNFDNFIKDLKELISYKSVLVLDEEGTPFGVETKKALHSFLNLAKSFGFETKNYDDYAGEIIFGEGEEIGIIGHLDVVPAGDGWETDPFVLTKVGDTYYGRGVSDDKGLSLMILYALKELKDSGIVPNKKFRFIVGCNEEAGWGDIKYLNSLKDFSFPEKGFSPDGEFPVTYAEKGITHIKFYLNKLKNFYGIKGGTVVNAVCGEASVYATEQGINEALIHKHGLHLVDGNKIVSIGKSCHGSTPNNGINALNALFSYFLEMGEDVKDFYDYVILDKSGIRKIENEQGTLTLSPDLISEENDKIVVVCDTRIPAPVCFDDIKGTIDSFGLEYTATERHEPFMIDKNCELVTTLLNAYKEITGDKNATPQYETGSTYARVFKEGCSFGGAGIDGFSAGAHTANEHIPEDMMKKMYNIYKSAIFMLAK